jgi:hypothetical protein
MPSTFRNWWYNSIRSIIPASYRKRAGGMGCGYKYKQHLCKSHHLALPQDLCLQDSDFQINNEWRFKCYICDEWIFLIDLL